MRPMWVGQSMHTPHVTGVVTMFLFKRICLFLGRALLVFERARQEIGHNCLRTPDKPNLFKIKRRHKFTKPQDSLRGMVLGV
jgi:hypothetical protein